MSNLLTLSHTEFEELLEMAQETNPEPCGRLLRKWRPRLLELAQQRLVRLPPWDERGSDLTQILLMKAMDQIRSFNGYTPEQLDRWLVAILDQTVIDSLQRLRAKKRGAGRGTSINAPGFVEPLRNASPSAFEEASKREQAQLAREVLAQLPPIIAPVVRLYQEKWSWEEIGAIIGQKPDAVRMMHRRAADAAAVRLKELWQKGSQE